MVLVTFSNDSRVYSTVMADTIRLLAIILHAFAIVFHLKISYMLATIKVMIYSTFIYNSITSSDSLILI